MPGENLSTALTLTQRHCGGRGGSAVAIGNHAPGEDIGGDGGTSGVRGRPAHIAGEECLQFTFNGTVVHHGRTVYTNT